MANTLQLSSTGRNTVDQARQKINWIQLEVAWQTKAEVSESTLDRFWRQIPIKRDNFIAICAVLDIYNWEELVVSPSLRLSSKKNNLINPNSNELLILDKSVCIPITKEEFEIKKEIFAAIERKLEIDFRNSPLSNPITGDKGVITALFESRKKLEIAALGDNSRLIYEFSKISINSWNGQISNEAVHMLRSHGEISIRCSCISTGAIAVIKIIQKIISNVTLYYEDSNGQELTELVAESNKKYDFIIVADSPIILTDSDAAKKYMEKYKILLPCFSVTQYVFKNKHSNGMKRISILKGSSQEEHLRYLINCSTSTFIFDKKFIDSTEFYFNEFDNDEVFIAWEPMASALERKMNIEKIPDMSYQSWVSLYSSWPDSSNMIKAFTEVFIAVWNYCNLDQTYSSEILLGDENYWPKFAIGSGMGRDKKIRQYLSKTNIFQLE